MWEIIFETLTTIIGFLILDHLLCQSKLIGNFHSPFSKISFRTAPALCTFFLWMIFESEIYLFAPYLMIIGNCTRELCGDRTLIHIKGLLRKGLELNELLLFLDQISLGIKSGRSLRSAISESQSTGKLEDFSRKISQGLRLQQEPAWNTAIEKSVWQTIKLSDQVGLRAADKIKQLRLQISVLKKLQDKRRQASAQGKIQLAIMVFMYLAAAAYRCLYQESAFWSPSTLISAMLMTLGLGLSWWLARFSKWKT